LRLEFLPKPAYFLLVRTGIPSYGQAMGTPSVSGDALRRSASDTASLGAARQIAPRSNAEGRQLGQAFLAQLEASANSMSNDLQSDPSGGGDDDQSAALPDMSAYSMLPAVTALQQGKQGTDRNMSALLSMISGATQATGGADALNADATGLPADPLPADTTTQLGRRRRLDEHGAGKRNDCR